MKSLAVFVILLLFYNSIFSLSSSNSMTFKLKKRPSNYNKFIQIKQLQSNLPYPSFLQLRKENSMKFNKIGGDHFVEICVGSQKKCFNTLFDTGSANFIVVGDTCDSPECVKLDKFSPSLSTSFKKTEDSYEVSF